MQHSELVTLALLARDPRHPYELNKQIDSMQVRRWAKLGASTVYKVLLRLAAKGLVRERSEQVQTRPPRKVYSITQEGRAALKQLVAEGLASPAPVFSDRLVAAVFADPHAPESRAQMADALARLEDSERRLKKMLRSPELSPTGRVVVEFQAAVVRAERSAIAALHEMKRRT